MSQHPAIPSSQAAAGATPPATEVAASRPSLAFHLLVAGWVAGMAWLASRDPQRYEMLMQEDRIVEWATVWLFLAAGVAGLYWSVGRRRMFDGFVALFCLFVAGEEVSWGQRLIGYSAPEFFLRNNFQQELNLHNLPRPCSLDRF